jgi:hypothetical protein
MPALDATKNNLLEAENQGMTTINRYFSGANLSRKRWCKNFLDTKSYFQYYSIDFKGSEFVRVLNLFVYFRGSLSPTACLGLIGIKKINGYRLRISNDVAIVSLYKGDIGVSESTCGTNQCFLQIQ